MYPLNPKIIRFSAQIPQTFHHGYLIPNSQVYNIQSSLTFRSAHSLPGHRTFLLHLTTASPNERSADCFSSTWKICSLPLNRSGCTYIIYHTIRIEYDTSRGCEWERERGNGPYFEGRWPPKEYERECLRNFSCPLLLHTQDQMTSLAPPPLFYIDAMETK